jgi:nicotinate-nucleotide adenylyltransferase
MVIDWILATERADEVWVIPTASHPFGKQLAPFVDRVDLCRAAFPHARIEEIEATLPAPSYTITTVDALRAKHPTTRFVLVVGTDVLAETPAWKDFSRLKTLVDLLPIRRAGHTGSERDDGTPLFPEVSSSEIRARLARGADVSGLVPAGALRLIRERRLYLG